MSATIHTIAKEAGVSVSTVSKVINGTGKISQETVARILKLIREHNYVPQQRRQTGNSIAVITFFYDNVSFAHSYDSNVLSGICKSAFGLGLDVTLVNGEKIMQMTAPELHRYFLTNSLSGAVLIGEVLTRYRYARYPVPENQVANNRRAVEGMHDPFLFFIDGTDILGSDGSECLVDGIHATDMAFYRMANALKPEIEKILGSTDKRNAEK